MFSYILMEFFAICLSLYDLLQIFRNCLRNLFYFFVFLFLYFFLSAAGSRLQRDRTGTGDRATYFVYIYLTSFALRRDVAVSRWAVPLSHLSELYPVVLVSSVSWCVLPFRWRLRRCMSSTTSSAGSRTVQGRNEEGRTPQVYDSVSDLDSSYDRGLPACCCLAVL